MRLDRPFARRRLPPRFDAEVSPLLALARPRAAAYDLTTDLALARREGPALGNAPGVAFAGSELWLPGRAAEARCATTSRTAAALASFGADSFRRAVELRGERR